MASVTYMSKKDTWLAAAMLGTVSACLAACLALSIQISPERRDQFLVDIENRRRRAGGGNRGK